MPLPLFLIPLVKAGATIIGGFLVRTGLKEGIKYVTKKGVEKVVKEGTKKVVKDTTKNLVKTETKNIEKQTTTNITKQITTNTTKQNPPISTNNLKNTRTTNTQKNYNEPPKTTYKPTTTNKSTTNTKKPYRENKKTDKKKDDDMLKLKPRLKNTAQQAWKKINKVVENPVANITLSTLGTIAAFNYFQSGNEPQDTYMYQNPLENPDVDTMPINQKYPNVSRNPYENPFFTKNRPAKDPKDPNKNNPWRNPYLYGGLGALGGYELKNFSDEIGITKPNGGIGLTGIAILIGGGLLAYKIIDKNRK